MTRIRRRIKGENAGNSSCLYTSLLCPGNLPKRVARAKILSERLGLIEWYSCFCSSLDKAERVKPHLQGYKHISCSTECRNEI